MIVFKICSHLTLKNEMSDRYKESGTMERRWQNFAKVSQPPGDGLILSFIF